jgi:transmembrane sensor
MQGKSKGQPFNKQINAEAAEWFVELTTGEPGVETRQRFDAWLRRSPEHVGAYLEMFSIWEDLARVDGDRRVTADELIALARASGRNVVELGRGKRDDAEAMDRSNSEESQRARSRRYRWGVAVAASLALVIAGWFYSQRGTYRTGTGEQQTIALADGSWIELNARSIVRVRFTDAERLIDLRAGQALFRVAHDPKRPFIVESGATRVRAVGTQFDVYRRALGTTVTVLEGRVAITRPEVPVSAGEGRTEAPLQLAAGEQVTVTPTATSAPAPANVEAATAWTQHRLIFSATPLNEVAEEFSRYSDRRLTIEGDSLDAFNVSGVFSTSDLPSFLRFLRAQPGVTVRETGKEIVISQP